MIAKMHPSELVAIIEAEAQGKVIECLLVEKIEAPSIENPRNYFFDWRPIIHGHRWNLDKYIYRVRKEPREWWISLSDDERNVVAGIPYMPADPIRAIHVREVI